MNISPEPLQAIMVLFEDQPNLLKILELGRLESEALFDELRKRGQFEQPINLYKNGRTGAGKSTASNHFLAANNQKPLKDGVINTTTVVQFFQLESNLSIFDLPGPLGDSELENINRAVLAMPPKTGRRVVTIDKFQLVNYTGYPNTKPKVKEVTVKEWQSPQYQEKFAPDIILYVVAPHQQFLDADYDYLYELLESQKVRDNHNRVVFLFNIFDGIQNMADYIKAAESKINEIYQQFYPSETSLPIFLVNCLTGSGFDEVTRYICKILPPEKLGKIEEVLRKDLKIYAREERIRLYRQAIFQIASRISRYAVDKGIAGQSLLEVASLAIGRYGFMTFDGKNGTDEFENEYNSSAKNLVDEVVASQTKVTTIEVPVMGTKWIDVEYTTRGKPRIEYDEYGNIIDVKKGKKKYKETEVMVDTVVDYKTQEVGRDYLKGGYPAIVFLVGFGLGIEDFYTNQALSKDNESPSNNLQTCLTNRIKSIDEKLSPYKSQIDELVESISPQAERDLHQILEKA